MPITFARAKNGTGNRKVSNWKPIHEAIVMGRVQGKTNTELSVEFNYPEPYISALCNSWQAKEIYKRVENRIAEEGYANITEERKAAIRKAQQRMVDFLNNDQLQKGNQLACVGPNIKIFETLVNSEKSIAPTSVTNITNNTQINQVLADPAKRDKLAEGLARADQVKEVHASVTGESVDNTIKLKESPPALLKLVTKLDTH